MGRLLRSSAEKVAALRKAVAGWQLKAETARNEVAMLKGGGSGESGAG